MSQGKKFLFHRGKGCKAIGVCGFVLLSALWIFLNQSVAMVTERIDLLSERSMQELLAIDSILYPSKEVTCPERKPLLTIIVYSALWNFKAREAIRKTWAEEIVDLEEILFLFLVGRSAHDRNLQILIEEEAAKNKDILQGDFEENYMNLTLKTGFMLKWLQKQCHTQSHLVLKIDDDVFLNWQNLGWFFCRSMNPEILHDYSSFKKRACTKETTGDLQEEAAITPTTKLFTGYLYKGVEPIRNPMSKWYLPRSLYSGDFLPDFVSGTAYIFSGNLVEPLYSELLRSPYFYLEDVFISGILTRDLNVIPTHTQGFNRFKPLWFHHCSYRDLITAHGLTSKELESVWDGLKHGRKNTCHRMVPSILLRINEWYLS